MLPPPGASLGIVESGDLQTRPCITGTRLRRASDPNGRVVWMQTVAWLADWNELSLKRLSESEPIRWTRLTDPQSPRQQWGSIAVTDVAAYRAQMRALMGWIRRQRNPFRGTQTASRQREWALWRGASPVHCARAAGRTAAKSTRKAGASAKRTTRQARKVPGVARAEGQVKGAVASEADLPIARYGKLNADEIAAKLTELSQVDLAKVDAFERKNDNRTTVLDRIATLRGNEPWPGYDEQTAAEIQTALSAADEKRAKEVRSYERAHKARASVLQATERELSNA